MSYPQIIDYNEAVQHPAQAFFDSDLRDGAVKENNLGLPLALSGGFALTYTVNTAARKYAVRCFHREIPEIEKKYEAIAAKLKTVESDYFVDFDFQEQGIRIRRDAYPIVRMDWVEGDPMGIWLDKNFDRPDALEKLRADFAALATFLEREGIAHGDIQNGNVMLSEDRIRLIDYDGMFVPDLPRGNGTETGHKHFQHPDRGIADYGPGMDRFSFIALDLSLQAVIADPALYRKFREGGETIIFKANDFADPQNSEIFGLLLARPGLKDQAKNFAAICDADISAVPTLEDFRAGRNIPTEKAPITAAPAVKAAPRVTDYIAPFPVVDALDFAAASRHVGDRVELIGRIVEVMPGVDKRKEGGRPFVYMSFAPSAGDMVKISVWSEGLDRLAEQSSNRLVGRWASVTGLIDPPVVSPRHGHTHLGITVEQVDQMQWLSEAEARFRLASIGKTLPLRNRDIVKAIAEAPVATSPIEPTDAGAAASSNREIVHRYVPQAPRIVPEPPVAVPPSPPPVRKTPYAPPVLSARPPFQPSFQSLMPVLPPPAEASSHAVPRWVWVSLGIGLLLLGLGLYDPALMHLIVAVDSPPPTAPKSSDNRYELRATVAPMPTPKVAMDSPPAAHPKSSGNKYEAHTTVTPIPNVPLPSPFRPPN